MKASHERIVPEKRLGEEAAQWLRQMSSDADEADDFYPTVVARNMAFREWYERSPQHLAAFLEICAVDDIARQVLAGPASNDASTAARTPPISGGGTRGAHSSRLRRLGIALLYIVVSMAAQLVTPPQVAPAEHYFTEIGERQSLKLSDGSLATLNTQSEVQVSPTGSKREVELLTGEAFFDVKHDAHHPFTVVTKGVRIRDIGTAFNVRIRGSHITVTVLSGHVSVELPGSQNPTVVRPAVGVQPTSSIGTPSIVLDPADRLFLDAHSGEAVRRHLKPDEVESALAWTKGQLSFLGTPLSEAVDEFNRYNKLRIIVADPAISRLSIGGRFHCLDPESFIAALQKFEGVVADQSEPGIVKLAARHKPASRPLT